MGAEIFCRLPWNSKSCLISESGDGWPSAYEASRQEAITPKKNVPLGDVQGRCTTPEAHINYVDNHALAPPKTPTPAKESHQTTQSDKKFEIPLPSIGALLLPEVQALPSLL